LSLTLISESVELPEPLKDEEQVRNKLAANLKRQGFDFSIEGEGVIYKDFFNEASISTNRAGNKVEVTYNISMTAKCIVAIILSLLLALLAGVALVVMWYLKYSRLKHSIRSEIGNLAQV